VAFLFFGPIHTESGGKLLTPTSDYTHVNNIIAVRLFQADYESIRVPGAVTGNRGDRNNFRLSMGVVFKIK
jgi:hypothetical protein